jgi:abortive infection bacteriophage resistance protein
MSFKTVDGLMRHLRTTGININGSTQKTQLINVGYFHGYKGYRFFQDATRRLPFISFEEVYATIQYDSKLKALLYDKMMFIETAVKNIALECIMREANSEDIPTVFEKVLCGYRNAPASSSEEVKKKCQQSKLNLQNKIQSYLARAYKEKNPKITHFYNNMNYGEVPIWALFEIMTMGDFGFLLSCLTINLRKAIAQRLGLNISSDTNLELIYKYIYTLKDLRNAIAHNAVVFDTRFRKIDPSKAMTSCLKNEINLPYVNFKTLGDYVILMCYYLKLLKVTKTEIKAFIREFERITMEYKKCVNPNVASIVIHRDLSIRMMSLKNYI